MRKRAVIPKVAGKQFSQHRNVYAVETRFAAVLICYSDKATPKGVLL